jgi:hypothetical protein
MPELVATPLRLLGFLSLLVLPGAWLAFGPLGRGLPAWPALGVAVALSPLVLIGEALALRALGVSFAHASLAVALGNAPALLLLRRRFVGARWPARAEALALLPLLAPLGLLALHFWSVQARVYYAHAWRASDLAYRFMAGDIRPEETSLAGFVLAFPWWWTEPAYQALLSRVLGVAPASSYAWTNLAWLLAVFVLTACLVARLGGSVRARALGCVLLTLSVGPIGSCVARLASLDLRTGWGLYLGEPGYTPWLRKFFAFDPLPLALGGLLAVVVIAFARVPAERARGRAVLLGLQLVTIGVVYPVLLPAGVIVVASRCAALLAVGSPQSRRAARREAAWMAGGAAVALAGVQVGFAWLAPEAWASLAPSLSAPWEIRIQIARSIVALALPAAGFAWAWPGLWRRDPAVPAALALAAAGCLGVYWTLSIPEAGNQYKYLLAVAVCLAPAGALPLDALLARLGRWGTPVATAFSLLLAVPPVLDRLDVAQGSGSDAPIVRIDGLDLALAPGEPYAAALDAIRERAPADAVVVAVVPGLHLPTLTRRVHYVTPASSGPLPGYTAGPEYFLRRGGERFTEAISERRRTVDTLYAAGDDAGRRAALETLLAFGRPIVVLLDPRSHAGLDGLLATRADAKLLHRGQGAVAWTIGH